MTPLIQLLLKNPGLLLFVVAAYGYLLGYVRVADTRWGVAAVLFVGLAFGALHPDLKLPELIYPVGLILFVYTIGISSARHFSRRSAAPDCTTWPLSWRCWRLRRPRLWLPASCSTQEASSRRVCTPEA